MRSFIDPRFFHPHFVAGDVHEQITGGVDTQILGACQRQSQLRNVPARRDTQVVFNSIIVAIDCHADSGSRVCGFRAREMRHAGVPLLRIIPDKIIALCANLCFALPIEARIAGHAQHDRAVLRSRGRRNANSNFLARQKDRQSFAAAHKLDVVVCLPDIRLKSHRNRKLCDAGSWGDWFDCPRRHGP